MVTDPAPPAASDPQTGASPKPDPALYTARVENSGGTSGRVQIRGASAIALEALADAPDGAVALPTGGPTPTAKGFNPEQFLAMAWSTCLGETPRVVMNAQGLEHPSQVSVEVGLHPDPAGGYRFIPRALVSIPGLDPDQAQRLVDAAHARCPVSKLLRGQGVPVVELRVQH